MRPDFSDSNTVRLLLDPVNLEDYRLFLKAKTLPRFHARGYEIEFPREYAASLGLDAAPAAPLDYQPLPCLFDYQRDISRLAIRRRKFAVFMAPGWGKTLIDYEYAQQALEATGRRVLFVAPLMVVDQMLEEAATFYGDSLPIEQVRAPELAKWICADGSCLGVTNFEAIRPSTPQGNLGSIIIVEGSMLKSHYGKWGTRLIEMGRGLDWKLVETGTPAPNDRIEYANHAVFLDQFPTVNSFLARYFVNRGKTDKRWEIKPHALKPFYRDLSRWCIFVSNPSTYGWKDNVGIIPPIHVHIEEVPLTGQQLDLVSQAGGDMFGTPGGIVSRQKLGQLAKGNHKGKKVATNKPEFIRDLVNSWPDESTLIWCLYNPEQATIDRVLPEAHSMYGSTRHEVRKQMLADFKSGRVKTLTSKSQVLGFGLNLQRATRQVFSGLADSYEKFTQCVHRSNRVGSTMDLNVHIPVTEVERPMIETVLRKAKRVQQDTEEQESLFKESGYVFE